MDLAFLHVFDLVCMCVYVCVCVCVAQGIEMADDFEGALEDLKLGEEEDDDNANKEEGDEDRIEQQMGDTGPNEEVGTGPSCVRVCACVLIHGRAFILHVRLCEPVPSPLPFHLSRPPSLPTRL